MTNKKLMKLIYASLFAALVYVGTTFISVTLPFGYFNFGDMFILISAWLIGGPYAIAATAIGSALADITLGFAAYAPATLVIKALVCVIAWKACKLLAKKPAPLGYAVAAAIAEAFMVLGYYIFEGFMYGFVAALASVPGNLLQSTAAVVSSVLVITLLKSSGLFERANSRLK